MNCRAIRCFRREPSSDPASRGHLLPRVEEAGPAKRPLSAGHRIGLFDQRLGHADRGDVDQAAVERDRALAFLGGLGHRLENAAGLGHFRLGRREHLIGQLDLRRMDRPLAFIAQHHGALGRRDIAVGIAKVAERSIDRAQAIGAARDHHARLRGHATGGAGIVRCRPCPCPTARRNPNTQVTVMKLNGEVVKTERVRTNKADLRRSLESVPKGSKVALESVGFCWPWIDFLHQLEYEPLLANPVKVKYRAEDVKQIE